MADEKILHTLGVGLIRCITHDRSTERRLQRPPNVLTYKRDIILDLRYGPIHTPTDGVPQQQRDLVRAVLHVADGAAQQLPGSCIGETWSRAYSVSQQGL